MLQKDAFPVRTKWIIIAIGAIAGLLWALPHGLNMHEQYSLYLRPLSLGAASVLAFTLYRPGDVKPWLCALLALPFVALMTGWQRWNFPAQLPDEFHFRNSCNVVLMLSLAMPWLVAFCNEAPRKQGWSALITAALWRNSFTLGVTALMTGLFWLVLLLWSRLFSTIGIGLFEQIFFDNAFFPPMATGAVIAAGIVYCRRLAGAVGLYRHLITQAIGVLLPLHAVASLLFLACLPFTGLAIIPHSFSAATLLLTMTLLMLTFSAIVGHTAGVSRWPGRVVRVAQMLTPLLAALAVWALWLRIADYGWTVERVYGAAVALIALTGSLLLPGVQRRAGAFSMDAFTASMLALTACLWFLLHTPAIDPWRITVKNQLARYEQGKAKADAMDLYAFSDAGRRGTEALRMLNAHPQWLDEPAQQKSMLMQILAGQHPDNTKPDVSDLRQRIALRAGSEAPPESWWQAQAQYVEPSLQTCLADAGSCLVWMQDLNNDGSPEVLLYNPNQPGIVVYARQGADWRQTGNVMLPQSVDKSVREGMPDTAIKPWRDLEINGQRYPVQYYGGEGQ